MTVGQGLLVGLVGCGRWGKNILRDLIALGCQVAVAVKCAASRDNAARGGAAVIVELARDLPTAAGFIVASPASAHAETLAALLPRRVPIFCEKPLTTDVQAARWLVEHAAGRLFVMDKWRYHPGILTLAKIARSGDLGRVLGLRTSRVGWALPQIDVNCAWTLLPHELTIALEILGHVPRPRHASAERALDGTLLSLAALLGDSVWHSSKVGIRGPARPRTVELICTGGIATLPGADSDHVLLVRMFAHPERAGERTRERRHFAVEQPLLAELRAFLNHLRGGPAPRSSVAEAATVVETIDQICRLAGAPLKETDHYLAG